MSDLISRQAALDALKGFNVVDVISYEHGIIYVQAVINAICNRLNNLPSIDPEREMGWWQIKETAYEDIEAKCSCCGFETLVNQPGNGLHMVNDLHFCPNCGTKMD